jgi:hypothetical protein
MRLRVLLYLLIGLVGVTVVLAALLYFGVPSYFKSTPKLRIEAEETTQSGEEIFAWIADITRLGWRSPGSEGGRRTRDYIARQFRSFGLRVAEPEPFEVGTFEAEDWEFTISDPAQGETESLPCHYIPFSPPTSEAGVSGELVYVGDGEGIGGIDLGGRIAVFENPARPALSPLLRRLFFLHDPDDTLATEPRILMQDSDFERQIYQKVRDAGAVGMVGLLGQMQWDSDAFSPQMNHGLRKTIPGVWIRKSLVERVRALARKGGVTGTIRMRARLGQGTAHNLWAELPGRTDEYYVVMGHYDSHYAQAVQDASGISVVLALAAHFASVRDRLPLERGIIFLAVDAHTIGRVGERYFVDRHLGEILRKTALVISAEHIGRRLRPQQDLSFAVSEVPSFRMLLTSWGGPVPEIAKAAVLHTDYRRSIVIPQRLVRATTGKARGISGEPFEAGLPTVGLLPAPPYLQFPEDTLEAVAEDELVPSTNLLIALIRAAEQYPLSELR